MMSPKAIRDQLINTKWRLFILKEDCIQIKEFTDTYSMTEYLETIYTPSNRNKDKYKYSFIGYCWIDKNIVKDARKIGWHRSNHVLYLPEEVEEQMGKVPIYFDD